MFKRKNTRIICHVSYTSTHSLPMSYYRLLLRKIPEILMKKFTYSVRLELQVA